MKPTPLLPPALALVGWLVCLPAGPFPALAQTREQVLELLASEEAGTRQKGYQALESAPPHWAGPAQERVGQLHAADLAAYRQQAADLLGAIEGFGTAEGRRRLSRAIERWQKEREAAVKAAFDRRLFPDPGPKAVIRGPYTGYGTVGPALARAEAAFKPLLELAERAWERLGSAEKTDERLAGLERLAGRIVERQEWLERQRRRHKPFQAEDFAFPRALALLFKGKAEEAHQAAQKTPPPGPGLFYVFCGLAILEGNRKADAGMSADAQAGVRKINELRMALGFLPLEVDKALTKCIAGHLAEMREMQYFGHASPRADRQTPQQRAALAGWKGTVGENIATAKPEGAALMWRWDGGHCRNMIDPAWTHVGAAWDGASGINVGSGAKTRLARPQFFPDPPR